MNWKKPSSSNYKCISVVSRKVCGKTPGDISIIKGRLRRIVKFEYFHRHVCPSAGNNLNGTGQIVMKHNIWVHSDNLSRKMKDLYNVMGRYSDSLRAGRSGDRSRWRDIFRTYPDGPWGPPSLLFNGHRAVPVGKGGRAMTLNTHPHLVLRSWKCRAIPPFPFWPRVVCYRVKPYFKLPYLYKHTAYFT